MLGPELDAPYMQALTAFLTAERAVGKTIYPQEADYFAALNAVPFADVKLVILGQDPYHGEGSGAGQAHGLSFSVKPNEKVPPSLKNIYKEMAEDLGITQPDTGYLMPWAEEGVLLLNAVLTVEAHKAASHQGKGWESFTDKIIEVLNAEREGLVFILWGAGAQKKGAKIDRARHLVLEGPHPSPLSAYRGFFGCKHFSQANAYLAAQGKAPVDWQLPSASNQLSLLD
ncbi:MAG: uracil-DNA glycosylase [Kordiimonadales bacterium]|nr:MAG: uracil-DNA glycosylase [Kordiimonadales bacterium]